MTAATRYRAPRIYRDVEVALDDFSTEEIREYLRHIDGNPAHSEREETSAEDSLVIAPDVLDRVATLALCGQQQYAREIVCQLVSEHIGRKL